MFVILALLLTFFAILLSYLHKKYSRLLKISKTYIGPPTLPILGNAMLFIGKSPEEYFHVLNTLTKNYGDTIKIWLGPEFNLLLSNAKDLETIMTSPKYIEKSNQYKYLNPWLREGLLISKGKKWFQRRKILTPAFHFKILEQYIEIFDGQSNKFIDILSNIENKNDVELFTPITLCTLDVICETAMGVTANAQYNSESEYVKAVKTISKILHKRMFNVVYRYDFIFNLLPLAREQKWALKVLHEFSENVIISRRSEILKIQKENISDENCNDIGAKKKMAFLDILLQSEIDGKPLTNLEIREEVDTFMFEGHDTTASAIHFCLYNLANYPEAQQKCFQEICKIIGTDKTKPITYQELNNLHYLELCIKETLRLYPSVPILGRKVNQESVINGKIIPAGTNIGICPFEIGRMENIFPNALKFIPERFDIETNSEKMNPFLYIPFSAGPRNCIGQKFAMFEIKSIVSKILRNYQLKYVGDKNGPILIAELILRSSNDLKFALIPRIYCDNNMSC